MRLIAAAVCPAALAALLLGGCEAGRGVAEVAGLATTPQDAKPFVAETRPVDPAYIPVGRPFGELPLCPPGASVITPPPVMGTDFLGRPYVVEQPPSRACKPRAAFATIEAELDAQRRANETASARAQALGRALPPPKPAPVPPQ